jgi:predicted NBD/HSP70 family sugar kinase
MSIAAMATHDDVRRNNLSRLLRLLHVEGATSRADLTARTGLNRSTVRALVTELAEAQLVCESPPIGKGSAGRPSITVAPRPTSAYALAVDLGVDHVTAARIGLGGVVLDRRTGGPAARDHDVGRALDRVATLASAMIASAPAAATCVGVGIGVAGVVSDDGMLRFAPNLGWHDVPLGFILADRLQLPVFVGNDGDVGAIAEHLRGVASGLTDVIYLSGEVGIGGGIIQAGRALRGAGGYGGEVGHMTVNPRGRLCRCGRRGCWETEVAEEAVLLATGAAPGTDLADVLEAHRAGEPAAVAGLRRVGRWIGLGVANLVNIFNPQMIVFGGTTRDIFIAAEPEIQRILTSALTAPREQVALRPAALGADSTLIGAAELAFASLLDNPLAVTA